MVDEQRRWIARPWFWVLVGAALMVLFGLAYVFAPSLLIGHPPNGLSAADGLKARTISAPT